MKNRIFITLLLSTVLALAGFAQQTNSNAQPAASADQTTPSAQPSATGREPLRAKTPDNFWDGDEPGIAWLVLHPFASKGYVQRDLQPIRDRLAELDELTAANSKMIKDVDSRAQDSIHLASTKTDEADAHTQDATNKVQLANQTTTTLNTRVSSVETVVGNVDQYKSATQTEIRFRPGQTALSKQAKDTLDEIATQLKDQHGYLIELQGFASGHGHAAIANSRKVADSVVRYLVLNKEIPAYRIYVIGMGNDAAAKRATGTRVEISLLKNDLGQTAKQ
jgi:outer membrane protein OmpA-like peptidoglycan-associated protein